MLTPTNKLVDHIDYYLDLILDNEHNSNFDPRQIITKHVLIYIVDDFNRNGHRPTDIEITDKFADMLACRSADRALISLSNKGYIDELVDENGEIWYSLTEKGKKFAKSNIMDGNGDSA